MEKQKTKLTDICDFQGGSQPPKEQWLTTPENGYIRMLQIRDFTQSGVQEEYIKLTPSTKTCKKDDILIARYGASVGKILTGLEGAYNVAIMKTIPNENVLQKRYLYYFLRTAYFQDTIQNVGSRAAQAGFNKSELEDIMIYLPSICEQEKITNILDKAQNLINKRKEQIRACDELIKSQFIEMFGDPITNPKGWEVKKLKDLSTKILSGNTPKGGSNVYVEDGIMFFRSQNVWKNRLELDDIAYIDQKTHESMSKSSLKHRDILMTKTGRINTENSSLGRAAMYLGEDDKANINGHVYLIRLQDNMVNEFVLFILTTNEYREYIRSVCVGGIDKRQLNKEHIEDFPIIYPPIELQQQFANFVQQVDKLKFEMEQSLHELENNFNALMQKAFSGQLF